MHTGLARQLGNLFIVTLKVVCKEQKQNQNVALEKKLCFGSTEVYTWDSVFNVFLCDLFFIMGNIDITSYADDNTPYTTGKSIE